MSAESRSNTSATAQPQTLTQSRAQAHRDYAIQIATEVGNEMEAEYAKKVPEYNERRELLFGDRDEIRKTPYNGEAFQQFFTEFLRRVKEGFVSKRVAKVEEALPRDDVPTELVAEIIDDFAGKELWGDAVLGMWPAEVLGIPSKIAQKLHEKQGKEFEQIYVEPKLMPEMEHWVKGIGAQVEESAAQQRREARVWIKGLRESVYWLGYSRDLHFLNGCRQSMSDGLDLGPRSRSKSLLLDEMDCFSGKVWDLVKRRMTDLGFKIEPDLQEEPGLYILSW
eukprot:g5486.t1